MSKELNRICIYTKDIQRITGKSYRQSTRLYQKIKNYLNKPENHFLSITEFCESTGLNLSEVQNMIK
ncbi:hypothetical protein Q764_10265 [Flavobacterium suncheonense GH29-5 = DSM 17707]|uniref:Uncharacterized protein n=1 Tax=Flavobacterium suncheonense GH29-5 = DSM 17707 TaxID=1121899 RepID=A0A0A2MBF4_9FLAO|nr:hypothetical protein [Flavobacterium suncheonense]KGO88981.1 hypothetical protein Q764_10265 [Flavobacterium suncheonense GH29-5 = DSM 17707]